MALKWGIVSAGKIAHDFVTAVETHPKENHEIVAVASNSLDKAQYFAESHYIKTFYGGYDKLAVDPEIEIVYVGNLNTQHFSVTKLMLEHGKHVLCEKPLTVNEKQTRKLIEIAREKKLFLMEAVWSRCFPAYKQMEKIIDSGEIGEVLFVNITFGEALQHIERIKEKLMGGGAILDLGVYILQFQQYIFRGLEPLKVAINGHLNDEGTDECASAVITYPNGKMAVVSTSARIDLPNEAIVAGTKGIIRMPDFWAPTELITPQATYNYTLPKSDVMFIYKNSSGLAYEAEEARMCIRSGKIESPQMLHDESIQLAHLMDLMRKEIGVVFPQDFQDF